MAWGQEQQSREAAQQLISTVIALEKELARLQEQRKADTDRYSLLCQDVRCIRRTLREVELKNKDFENLLERVQYLEGKLTTFGADFQKEYVASEDFVDYQKDLVMQAKKLKYDLAIAEAEKVKTTRRQWGLMAMGFLGGFATIAPKLWELIGWLIQKIMD